MSSGTISIALLRPVLAALPKSAYAAFFRATDTSLECVADAEHRVSAAQFCIAWSELIRWTCDPAIALRIAETTPVGAFGIVEYVCRSQPTLGAALAQWVRYLNILDDAVEVALVDEDQTTCLRVVVESEAPAPASHELCFAILVRQARETCAAPFDPVAIELTHPARVDPAAYSRWFGAPVRFDAAQTQLVFARASLDVPLRTADAALAGLFTETAERQASALSATRSFVDDVRREVERSLRTAAARPDSIAKALGMTDRSLQRRLKAEGTTLSAIKREVRKKLAEQYLHEGLSTAEISFILGFSEPSAFFRAFKRWNGITPLEHRALHP